MGFLQSSNWICSTVYQQLGPTQFLYLMDHYLRRFFRPFCVRLPKFLKRFVASPVSCVSSATLSFDKVFRLRYMVKRQSFTAQGVEKWYLKSKNLVSYVPCKFCFTPETRSEFTTPFYAFIRLYDRKGVEAESLGDDAKPWRILAKNSALKRLGYAFV